MFVRRHAALEIAAALAILAIASPASAVPLVTFTTTDLGGGVFQYDLTLDNDAGPEPFSGLNILNANSVFGLDGGSSISAPSGWSFFAPLPPWVDELNFFSLATGSDVAVNASLAGFSFQSSTDPDTIGGTFAVEAIGGTSSSQIPLAGAVYVPEPSTLALLAIGLLAGIVRRRSRLGPLARSVQR
jgi:hypothetical protein